MVRIFIGVPRRSEHLLVEIVEWGSRLHLLSRVPPLIPEKQGQLRVW